jgi:RNA polymerase sigma-70 factor (ECF subfamily)
MHPHGTLITLLKQGDESVFKDIYNKYYYPILNNIAKWVADRDSQEDLLQEVFMELWNKKEHISPEADIGGWLFTKSYYLTMTHLRKALKVSFQSIEEHNIEALSPVADEDVLWREEKYSSKLALLKSAIELLPEQKKRTFILYKVQGLSYVEIAQQMGISEFSVRQYVKLAMSHLKKQVKIEEADLYILCVIVFSAPFFA